MSKRETGSAIDLDVKAVAEDGTFTGYAAIFGTRDRGGDVVMPGAFTKSLQTYPAARVRMLWQHDTTEPVGVFTKFEEDAIGLKAEGRLILETARGASVHALMKAGAIDGLSIGYRAVRHDLDRATKSRRLHEVELREVSIVTFPMNEGATVSSVKSHTTTDFSELVVAINAARSSLKG